MAKRVLLLGGGAAHLAVLQALARERLAGAEVALLAPFERALHAPMRAGLVTGRWRAEDAALPLRPWAEAAGVQLIEGQVAALDARQRRATLADGRVAEYDLLSLNPAPVQDRDRLPGARQQGLFAHPLEHFARLLEGLWDLAAQRVLDVVVVGGDALAVELALALEHRLAGRGEERARVALVTGGPEPLAGYGPAVQARAAAALARRRITVFRDACKALEPGVLHLASGARLACDAPVIATPAEAPPWLAGSGLMLDAQGWVATSATLQSTSHPEVLVARDAVAGAGLAMNLRRLVGAGRLQPLSPKQPRFSFIASGAGRAIVHGGAWAAEGTWAGWWKDRRDRRWVQAQRRVPPVR